LAIFAHVWGFGVGCVDEGVKWQGSFAVSGIDRMQGDWLNKCNVTKRATICGVFRELEEQP
jgi:hypothetical protein